MRERSQTPTFSRRQYIWLANFIAKEDRIIRTKLIEALEDDNPKFDKDKFNDKVMEIRRA